MQLRNCKVKLKSSVSFLSIRFHLRNRAISPLPPSVLASCEVWSKSCCVALGVGRGSCDNTTGVEKYKWISRLIDKYILKRLRHMCKCLVSVAEKKVKENAALLAKVMAWEYGAMRCNTARLHTYIVKASKAHRWFSWLSRSCSQRTREHGKVRNITDEKGGYGKSLLQLNLYLHTQLVKNGCTYCEKYLNWGMDSHRLTCEMVQLVDDLPKNIAKIWQALRITCKGVWLVNDLSQKIPKLHKNLKQNVNWNQTLLNEVDLTV